MVDLKNYLHIIKGNLFIFGIHGILKEFHNQHGEEIRLLLKGKINISTYYYWISGKSPIPLNFLRFFNTFDKKLLDSAYSRFTYISAGRKRCHLPKILDEDISYIIGVVHGDGHLHRSKGYVNVTCDLRFIKEKLVPLFNKVFGIEVYTIKCKGCYRLEFGSRAVHSFLALFCPVGKKSLLLKVPQEVKTHKNLLSAYLSGLFDTDGCVGYYDNGNQFYFTIVQRSKDFIFEVYESLLQFGLHVNRPRAFRSPIEPYANGRELEEWRIYIGSRKDLLEFLNVIHFNNPTKNAKARAVVSMINGLGRI